MSVQERGFAALCALIGAGWDIAIDCETVIVEQINGCGRSVRHAYRHDDTSDGIAYALLRAKGGGADDNAEVFS